MKVRAWLFVGLIFLAQGLGGVGIAFAAAVTDAQVYASRQSTSLTTDIDVRFTTADAVNGSTDTITLTIPTGFSLGSLNASHVRLSHGPTTGLETEEVLAGVPAAGVWGVMIAGRVITLTAPTDAGASEIGVGERVSIRFGFAYGQGAQITNPDAAGIYQWQIGGTFGGEGYPFSPVVSSADGGFTISFTVDEAASSPPAASTGGGATSAAIPPPVNPTDAASTPQTPPTDAESTPQAPPTDAESTPQTPPPTTPTDAASTPQTPPAASTPPSSAAPSTGSGTGSGSAPSSGGSGSTSSGGGGAASAPSIPTSPVPTAPSEPVPDPATEPLVPLVPTEPVNPPPTEPISPSPSQPTESTTPTRVPRQGMIVWTLPGSLRLEQPQRLRLYTDDGADVLWTGLRPGSRVTFDVGQQTYVLNERDGGYVWRFVASSQVGAVQGRLRVQYGTEAASSYPVTIEQVGGFRVRGKLREGDVRGLEGATVQVSRREGRAWRTVQTVTAGREGMIRAYLAAGTYRLEAKQDGYVTLRQEFTVPDGALSGEMTLQEGVQSPLAAIDPDASLAQNVANVAGATVEAVAQTLQDIRTPEVQTVAQVSAPVAVAASVGVTAAASSFQVLNYLHFLFTQPLLLLRRRKREKWGLVYNAITKQPIDLAVVRLLDAKTNAVRQTRLTDAQGRFAFLVPAGEYRLEVVKPPFLFPSQTLAKQTMDVDLVDLYHGEVIQSTGSATLTPNIPLDPVESTETPKEILKKARWRKVQQGVSIGGLGVGVLAYVLQPTLFVGGLAVVQVGAFLLFRRLAVPRKPKNWGIAYDATTRKPLGRAIVRIFDKKYNKLLETQVTDNEGKYAFFAGKNIYYVTADREGYERAVSPDIDLTKESLGVVRAPIALVPKTPISSNAT